MNLDREDRQQLITLLQHLPELGREQDRRTILESAGLKQLASNIDLSGSPSMAVSRIVGDLSEYGRFKDGNQALELFLKTIKDLVGFEQQEFLQRLLQETKSQEGHSKPNSSSVLFDLPEFNQGLFTGPNPIFTGRKAELKQLEKLLLNGQDSKICTIAGLSGSGGIGKSALAYRFA